MSNKLKFAICATVLSLIPLGWSEPQRLSEQPISRKSTPKHKTQTEQPKNNDDAKAIAALASDLTACLAIKQPNADSKQNEAYDPRQDTLYRVYLGSTVFGVLAGLGGIGAIYSQTRAIRRSVELQEAAMDQWVEVAHEWEINPPIQVDGKLVLDITFWLFNPTNYPLILRRLSFDLNGRQHDMQLHRLLPPKKKQFFGGSVYLTQEQENMRQTSTLSIFVDGEITYTSALKKDKVQPLHGGVACQNTKGVFIDMTRVPEKESN